MSGRSVADVVLAHIGHAERWLRRARADYERGDLHQVVLRLLLAEAEIRRARESGAAIAELPPRRESGAPIAEGLARRRAHVSWAVLGAVVAAGLILAGYTLIRPAAPGPVAQAPGFVRAGQVRDRLSGIVRFDTGQVLEFVGFPGRAGGTAAAQGAPVMDVDRLITISDDGPALVTFR